VRLVRSGRHARAVVHSLSSLGLAYPNAAALSLVPFDPQHRSASAMLGFLQIGVSGLAAASIGIFDSHTMMPVTLVPWPRLSWIGLGILPHRPTPDFLFALRRGKRLQPAAALNPAKVLYP